MGRTILLSGAASLVGAEVLRELLAWPEIETVRLLVPGDEPRRRRTVERLAAYLGPLPRSVAVVAGDLLLP
ncbi:MAG TPA: hypothetical protein VE075_03200, partial [Thermoanaerobaculia bacterium]|nr:hypothetical protein [Thermoanaerobaculia bacterium]